jgi:hypothetical protein
LAGSSFASCAVVKFQPDRAEILAKLVLVSVPKLSTGTLNPEARSFRYSREKKVWAITQTEFLPLAMGASKVTRAPP